MARPLNRQELMDEIRMTLVTLCKSAVVDGYVARVEGLIGVTTGNNNVFLINIREDIVSCKEDPFQEKDRDNGPSFDADGMETGDANLSTKGTNEIPELDSSAHHTVGLPKYGASKIDMLVRYSTDLFDQFSRDTSKRPERQVNYGTNREVQQKVRKAQTSHTEDHLKDVHSFPSFAQNMTSFENDYQCQVNQCFTVKEEPESQSTLEEAMIGGELTSANSGWRPVKVDDSMAVSRKSSSLGQSAYDIHVPGNNDFGGEQATTENPKQNETAGNLSFMRQQQWLGGTFDTFQASNGFTENYELRPFVCELCDASFTKKFCLANHIVTIHQVGGKYVCKHCGKQFLQKLRYLTHMDRHNNIRRHVCQVCGKAFSYKYSLWSHAKKCVRNGGDLMQGNETASYIVQSNQAGGDDAALVEDVTENSQ